MLSGRQSRRVARLLRSAECAACPVCSTTTSRLHPRLRPSTTTPIFRRHQSTATATATSASSPRAELEKILRDLQAQAPNLVNLPRLQLALQGLQQRAGTEAVRVAVLGLASPGGSDVDNGGRHAARRVLGALLADPLDDRQAWEAKLEAHDPARPLVVRVRPNSTGETVLQTERASTAIEQERVSSAALNGLNLELLLMEASLHATTLASPTQSVQAVEDAVLSPVVEIPAGEGRFTPVASPVHKTILVGSGIGGAVGIATLPPPVLEGRESILAVADLEGLSGSSQAQDGAPFEVVDVAMAEKALALFREGPQHAMEYERLWYASRMPVLLDWLKAGLASDADEGVTKPAVRQVVTLLLQNTLSSIDAEDKRRAARAIAASTLPEAGELSDALAQWAQRAHAELQGELDLAFTGRRWRQLGWWKLFWRVDDVAMLTNEMLAQRFLPTAEQELVYLTGRIAGAAGEHASYPQPKSASASSTPNPGTAAPTTTKLGSGELTSSPSALPEWPGHIAFTRRYLQNETIPALQALAQSLVAQAVGTSSATAALAALVYVSQFTSGVYEAGAVAALGIVYSLGRMQKKWERARDFWQGEVREEGRKAVRGAEDSVAKVLEGDAKALEHDAGLPTPEELQRARDLVAKAEEALSRVK